MKLSIQLHMPEPAPKEPMDSPHKPGKTSIEDQVRTALDLIDSGHTSNVEWRMINRLYRDLSEMTATPRITNLIGMIKPVLAKFGYHDVTAAENK